MPRNISSRIARVLGPTVLVAAATMAVNGGVATAASPCVTNPGELTPDAVARATDSALAGAPAGFPDRDVSGAYATGATRSASGPVGQQIIDECGADVQRKSVIVDMTFPAMLPDAGLSHGAAVVSTVDGQYQVWRTA